MFCEIGEPSNLNFSHNWPARAAIQRWINKIANNALDQVIWKLQLSYVRNRMRVGTAGCLEDQSILKEIAGVFF